MRIVLTATAAYEDGGSKWTAYVYEGQLTAVVPDEAVEIYESGMNAFGDIIFLGVDISSRPDIQDLLLNCPDGSEERLAKNITELLKWIKNGLKLKRLTLIASEDENQVTQYESVGGLVQIKRQKIGNSYGWWIVTYNGYDIYHAPYRNDIFSEFNFKVE